jgi:hypothetical protein
MTSILKFCQRWENLAMDALTVDVTRKDGLLLNIFSNQKIQTKTAYIL